MTTINSPFHLENVDDIDHFLERFDSFLIDCDGVLWYGKEMLPHTKECLDLLLQKGKKLVFVTNNSTKSRAEYLSKFSSLQLPLTTDCIIPSTYAVGQYLSTKYQHIKKVFTIGSKGLFDELHLAGLKTITHTPTLTSEDDFKQWTVDSDIQAVVVGCDFEVNYSKIAYGSLCLQKNPGCLFVATSRDTYDQLGDRKLPGMTASLSGIETSCGISPVVVGKPSPWLIEHLLNKFQMDPSRTCMIGDRLDSDILFGKNGKIATLLVLSGCTSQEDLISLISLYKRKNLLTPPLQPKQLRQQLHLNDNLASPDNSNNNSNNHNNNNNNNNDNDNNLVMPDFVISHFGKLYSQSSISQLEKI